MVSYKIDHAPRNENDSHYVFCVVVVELNTSFLFSAQHLSCLRTTAFLSGGEEWLFDILQVIDFKTFDVFH